jgi:hypothetical protein
MLPIITTLMPLLGNVLDRLIPNVAEREKIKMELQLKLAEQEGELIKALVQSDVAQIEVNKIEAESENPIKSLWRPALAWVCVLAFTWLTVIQPVVSFVYPMYTGKPLVVPEIDTSILTTVLFGVLGLAGYRTYEKKTGITK